MDRTITLDGLRLRLAEAHRRTGGAGRFSFTMNQTGRTECFVTHWLPPGPSGFGDCRTVAVGTPGECLDALDRYAAAYERPPTEDELARTLGVARCDDRLAHAAD